MKLANPPSKAQIRRDFARHYAQALANIAAVERQPVAPSPLDGQIVPGEIYLANESVFTHAISMNRSRPTPWAGEIQTTSKQRPSSSRQPHQSRAGSLTKSGTTSKSS